MNKKFKNMIIMFLSVLGVLVFIICIGFLGQMLGEYEDSFEEYNKCSNEASCQCRDACERIMGYSTWDTWIYEEFRRDSQCHCITSNGSIELW